MITIASVAYMKVLHNCTFPYNKEIDISFFPRAPTWSAILTRLAEYEWNWSNEESSLPYLRPPLPCPLLDGCCSLHTPCKEIVRMEATKNYKYYVRKRNMICLQFHFSCIYHCCNCSIFILHSYRGIWFWVWISNHWLAWRCRTSFCDFPPAISYTKLVYLVIISSLHVLIWYKFNWGLACCKVTLQLISNWTEGVRRNNRFLFYFLGGRSASFSGMQVPQGNSMIANICLLTSLSKQSNSEFKCEVKDWEDIT